MKVSSRLEKQYYKVCEAIAEELERRATAALWQKARRNRGCTVTFLSAMGTQYFDTDNSSDNPPKPLAAEDDVITLFEAAICDYGYNTIPVVFLSIKDGVLTKLTDW